MASRIPHPGRDLQRNRRPKTQLQRQKKISRGMARPKRSQEQGKNLLLLLPVAFLLLIFENLNSSPRVRRGVRALTKLGNPRIRFAVVWGLLMAGMLGLSGNLYRLQIVQGEDLQEQARQQQDVKLQPFIPRRAIVDRNNNVLALDRPVYTLYAHPKLFKISKEEMAGTLAPILNQSSAELFGKFNQAESGISVAMGISEENADRIRDTFLDGLELEQNRARYYPQKNLAADVVGYVDTEGQGQAGIEVSHQHLLAREASLDLDRRLWGSLIPDPVPAEFMRLDDLHLQITLDLRLQQAARTALEKHRKQWNAKRGTAIVMDAKTGEILALVCDPSYDPNEYFKFDVELFKNWALTDLYEPGSTFKPIAVAIALEAGAIEPNSVFYDEGRIYVDEWPISNSDGAGRGYLSVKEIIRYSSNVGMVHIIEQMRSRVFYSWLQRLGIGDVLGADLPFETASQLRSRSEFMASPVNAATASFGQGLSLTPLQLVQINGALANEGYLVTPHVVRGLFDSQGRQYWQPDRRPHRQVFSATTTQAVVSMMEEVIDDGTGTAAQIPGYRIAGKTGTSQKANDDGKGYSEYARIASFVAILPADNPRYVVLAAVDEPVGGYGGTVAAPIVKDIMEALIQIEGIAPSDRSQTPVKDSPPVEDSPAVEDPINVDSLVEDSIKAEPE